MPFWHPQSHSLEEHVWDRSIADFMIGLSKPVGHSAPVVIGASGGSKIAGGGRTEPDGATNTCPATSVGGGVGG